jgi:hypothetical protein
MPSYFDSLSTTIVLIVRKINCNIEASVIMVRDWKKNLELYQQGNAEPYQYITDLRICNTGIQIKIRTRIRIKTDNESGKIPA